MKSTITLLKSDLLTDDQVNDKNCSKKQRKMQLKLEKLK